VGEVLENLSADKHHQSIEESDSEDALTAWLREGGVTDAWKIAPVLVGAGLEMSALVSLREDLPKNAFGDAVRWIALRMKLKTLLDDAEQSTGRIASLVEAVRSIARQERAEAADIDVHEQLRSALGVLDHKLKNLRVAQNFSSESGHVRGYPSELAQVWVNLLDNAADAVNGGGEIAIQTRRDDNQTVVEVIDNGPGIPPQNLSHIFEPFFTTKGVGSGKGLGLTISQGIVGDRHGGEIEVESKAGETRFIVRLPVRQIERNEGAEASVATRAYLAELTEQLEEMESPPPPQTHAVSNRSFATVFDVPLFAQLNESQRGCLSMGTEVRFARGEIILREGDPCEFLLCDAGRRVARDKVFRRTGNFPRHPGSGRILRRDSNSAGHPEFCAHSSGRRQPAFSSAARRILGPATHLAYGGEGNHADAGDTIAQYGGLLTGAREAHPTWRDGGRACP
jgi:Histidine kinase-, DNA gyrase B-, and HSP90-like ATPase